ncbi:granzyme A-like [Phyllobates terribilis]|uniref:granzyme A-like n=1 Tax=Phyllobates terribilis TaxID=111132 RepID=UPI003CCAEA84
MMTLFCYIFLAATIMVCDGGRMKIINGDEVYPHSRPYMAFIATALENITLCAGSLIKPNWVLTAAHCRTEVNKTKVSLGIHSLKANETENQMIKVIASFHPKQYQRSAKRFDIKLLQLSRDAELSPAVDILPLPDSDEDVKADTVCQVAGWGETENNKFSDTLREVNVTIFDREQCKKIWRHKYVISDNMICTSVGADKKDTCKGDSGSPLICEGVFRGINSFGYRPCGTPHTTNVYTRLSNSILSWIHSIINDADRK